MTRSDIFFLLTLALIPIQLGKFFFQDYSYVLGIPIDYRAVTVYASDIALVLYIAFFTLEHKLRLIPKLIDKKILATLILFDLYLFINSLFFSISKEASLFQSLKITLFSLFAIFAATTLAKKDIRSIASKVIYFSLLWQFMIVLWQLILQRSLGLWALGERAYSSLGFQVAHIDFLGNQITRPYGTFSHPNILGAFFVIFLILGSILQSRQSRLLAILYSVGIILTFSKSSAASLILYLFILEKNLIFKIAILLCLIPVTYSFINYLGQNQLFSIAERLQLAQAAIDISLQSFVFGVGPNNFIIELSKLNLFSIAQTRLLQPVHNLFLLVLTETGIIGLVLLVAFLFQVSANLKDKKKIAFFLVLLLFSTFDHFFWTIQQGQFLFWLSMAVLLNSQKTNAT